MRGTIWAGRRARAWARGIHFVAMVALLAACGGSGDGPTPPPNQAPAIAAQTFTGDEDADITGTLAATDPENSALTFTRISDPTRGTVSNFQSNGAFTYRGNSDTNGNDTFQVRVSDAGGLTGTATVTISVRNVNDAPTARDDVIAATGGPTIALDVLANDSDPDNEPLLVEITTAPSVGTASVGAGGVIGLDLPAAFVGFVRLDYRITDSGNLTRNARTLAFVNAAPQKIVFLAGQPSGLGQLWVHDFFEARPVSSATDVCIIANGSLISPARGGSTVLYPRCNPGSVDARELEIAPLEGSGSIRTVPMLPAGSRLTSWAISRDGVHFAYAARVPATATEPETCVIRTAPVADPAAINTLHADDAASGWCGNVFYGSSGQYLYSTLRVSPAPEAAFVRWPAAGGPMEFVFGSISTPRALQTCVTYQDDSRYLCAGALAPGDSSLSILLVTMNPRTERAVTTAPLGAIVVLNANRQFTHAGWATQSTDPLQRRLFVADLASQVPPQEIGTPHADRIAYGMINFSADGQTMLVLDRTAIPPLIGLSYEVAYEARADQNWQLNRIYPALAAGESLTATLPRVVAGNDAVLLISQAAGLFPDPKRTLLRVPRADPSQPVAVGPDEGVENYFVPFEDSALVLAVGFRSDTPGRTLTVLNPSTTEGALVISSPTGNATATVQTPFTPQPTR